MNVILDTNILRQEGIDSQNMQRLLNLAAEEMIKIYIPDIVAQEYLTQTGKEYAEELKKFDRYIDRVIREKLFPDFDREKLIKIGESIKEIKDEKHINSSFEEEFNKWIRGNNIKIIDIGIVNACGDKSLIEMIIDDYFHGKNAFRSIKYRDDFPDAIIWYEIFHVIELEPDRQFYVVVKDGNFRNFLKKNNTINTVDSLNELFSLKEFEEKFNNLEKKSTKIKDIKEKLSSSDAKTNLSSFVYSDSANILHPYWDENSILDPGNIIELKFKDVYIDIESDNNEGKFVIDKVEIGDAKYISFEVYAVEYNFTAFTTLKLTVNPKDYLELDENKKRCLELVESGNDVCFLDQDVECRFVGIMTLGIPDELTPIEVAAHLNYLKSTENPIFITSEINQVIVIGNC